MIGALQYAKKKKKQQQKQENEDKTKDYYMERDGVGVELDLGGFRSSANRCKRCCCCVAAAAIETWRSSAKCEPFLLRKLAPRTWTDVNTSPGGPRTWRGGLGKAILSGQWGHRRTLFKIGDCVWVNLEFHSLTKLKKIPNIKKKTH